MQTIEKYKKIKNDAFNAIARRSSTEEQKLELWGPTREIIYQKGIKTKGNQLDNARVLRLSSGNLTKRLKLRILTRVEK